MKNQYFGDNKDLFTYDLIMQIMQGGLVENFAFIPMLTSNDGTGHGKKSDRARARVGTKNKELVSFLDGCLRRVGQVDLNEEVYKSEVPPQAEPLAPQPGEAEVPPESQLPARRSAWSRRRRVWGCWCGPWAAAASA